MTTSVPKSITRADYVALLEEFGFKPEGLSEIVLRGDGVHAVVIDRDENGNVTHPVSAHRVYIPVED